MKAVYHMLGVSLEMHRVNENALKNECHGNIRITKLDADTTLLELLCHRGRCGHYPPSVNVPSNIPAMWRSVVHSEIETGCFSFP